MQQRSLWNDIEAYTGLASARAAAPAPQAQETPHHHIKLWFYDSRHEEVVICSEEPDYYTRYHPDEIWSVQFVGGSLTFAGCTICHPAKVQEDDHRMKGEQHSQLLT